jgi:hypothetical protein
MKIFVAIDRTGAHSSSALLWGSGITAASAKEDARRWMSQPGDVRMLDVVPIEWSEPYPPTADGAAAIRAAMRAIRR